MDQSLLDAFERCAGDPQADEVRMAVLVARALDHQVDDGDVLGPLAELSAGLPPGKSPWAYLRDAGFGGDVPGYAHLDNSNLARVLSRRKGIPITLGVLLMAVSRHAGLRAHGINFPGHFLVDVDGEMVDPFLMASVEREQCLARLPAALRAADPAALFARATPVAVGLRMLNNVRQAHAGHGAWHEALDIVDAQLRLAPGQPALHIERGDLWARIGLVTPAREAFERARTLAARLADDDGRHWLALAEARLTGIGDAGDVVH